MKWKKECETERQNSIEQQSAEFVGAVKFVESAEFVRLVKFLESVGLSKL